MLPVVPSRSWLRQQLVSLTLPTSVLAFSRAEPAAADA